MDNAQQHWKILRELETDLANKVRSFMVIGKWGDGVLVTTEDGVGYWLGTMRFRSNRSKTMTKPIPLNVPGLVVQMAHGVEHILLLNDNGQIYSMKNYYGGLLGLFGLETADEEIRLKPLLISKNQQKFISVRCGHNHSLALTEDGKVWARGNNKFGQIGMRRFNSFFQSPCEISELDRHRFVAVECGGGHSLALTDRGDVYAWGGNNLGQLVDESKISTHTPARIFNPRPVKSIAAGSHHTLLLTRTGEVWACGSNKFGQLGFPTTTAEYSAILYKVKGLPPILQIASHPLTSISIAMSFDQRCFVWGELHDQTSISTPRELPPFYSTVESPLSFYSIYNSISHSVTIPETFPNRLSTRMSRMFDNLETSDVQFVVEQRTIHAHRNILINTSDYFDRLFSERWLAPVDPENSIVIVTIPDVSYQAFHAFLRFLYTDCLELHPNLLPELFELANLYLVPDLQQFCLSRMRATLSFTTCCLYYPLTHRHSIPELATFQQELVQFASIRMSEVVDSDAYQSMEPDLCDNLINAVGNFLGT